jgi:hypothetical protein
VAVGIAILTSGEPASKVALSPYNYRLNLAKMGANSTLGMGDDSMKIGGRLRWVVNSDREDLAHHEASQPVDREGSETSSLAQRILKNLALIRAYETQKHN